MGYFIDNMMDADKIKYKERSICAINGIRQLISDIQLILSCNTIKGKYYQIAQYIGLATENEKSYYNYFIPINSDIVFLLRFSDHNNTNPSLYNQHERNGRPNKRFIIPFVGNIFQNSGPTPFLGAEHHVVSYPVNALDDEASIKLFLSDLQRLFTNGETNFTQLPQQPIQENKNKQINTNKNIMKLTEKQLRRIIKESIERTLDKDVENATNDTQNSAKVLYDLSMNAFNSIGNEYAKNLICYLLNPRSTAIKAGFEYNAQTIEDLLWQKSLELSNNFSKMDENAKYTFNAVIEMAKNGEFDI